MAKKKRKRRPERPGRPGPGGGAGERDVEQMIVLASEAFHSQDGDLFDQATGLLEHGPPDLGPEAPRLVDRLISKALLYAMRRAWINGWQPADIVRSTGRSLDRRAAVLSVDVIAEDMVGYAAATVHPYWRQQVSDIGATIWWSEHESHLFQWGRRHSASRIESLRTAASLLSVLHHLPHLPLLCPIPGDPAMGATGTDAQWGAPRNASSPELERIRALLTKAESTTFPEEAEALSAKAQQLMATHSIDRIALDPDGAQRRPIGRRLGIDDPYAGAKSLLLDKIADANRCRSVWSSGAGFATVFGDEADVASVDLLFTSLLTQATAALRVADRQRVNDGRGQARSFRQSFHLGYALRIGARLAEAVAEMEEAAAASFGADLLPVLASHADDVDQALDAAFPGLVQRAISASNRAGWASGTAAADAASLTVHPEVDG